MATRLEDSPQFVAIQRARAEEQRQRQEEKWYVLEIDKQELEKTKIEIDVLKHFVTIITALLLILSYFGTQLIPLAKTKTMFGYSYWFLIITGFFVALVVSLGSLVMISNDPLDKGGHRAMRFYMFIIFLFLATAILVTLVGLFTAV